MADRNRMHLIVQGSRGRSGIDYAVHGSVAEEIVGRAPCPVLTVKTSVDLTPRGAGKNPGRAKHNKLPRSRPILTKNLKVQNVL